MWPVITFSKYQYQYYQPSYILEPNFRRNEMLPQFAKQYGYDYAFKALLMSSRERYVENRNGFALQDHGYRHVVKDGKWGLCDDDGKELLPCVYDSMDFVYLTSGLCIVLYKKDGKCGGHWFYPELDPLPLIYDSLYWDNFHFPYMIVYERNGKEGIMDFNQVVKVPEYKHLRPLCHRHFPDLVAQNDMKKFGIIDLNNNVKIPFDYDRIYRDNHLIIGEINSQKSILMEAPEDNWEGY